MHIMKSNSGCSYSACCKVVHLSISQLTEIQLQLQDKLLVSDRPKYVKKISVYSIPQISMLWLSVKFKLVYQSS